MTRRTVVRLAGATAVVGGLAAALPAAFGSNPAAWLGSAVEEAAPMQMVTGAGSASLSDNVRKFAKYARPTVVSLAEVATEVGMPRPVNLRKVNDTLAAIPPEVRLGTEITTEAALGGQAELILRSDGSYTSSGHMRATGFPSFAYHVTPIARSADGGMLVTAFHQGRVFGTDTPGDRSSSWNESGRNDNLREHWLSFAGNVTFEVRKEYEVAGTLGAARDVAVKIAEFAGAAVVTNPATAAVMTLGPTLADALHLPSPHNSWPLGVTVAAGTILCFGPGVIVPAFVAGASFEAGFQYRNLHPDEWAVVTKVFGNNLPPAEKIFLTTMFGLGNRAFTVPAVGETYLVNIGGGAFEKPLEWAGGAYPVPGQLLIHELTHVWQATRPPAVTYYCRGIAKGDGYEPGADPAKTWGDYGIEQQASIVDQWFADMCYAKWRGLARQDFVPTAFYRDVFTKSSAPDYRQKPENIFDRYVYDNIHAGMN